MKFFYTIVMSFILLLSGCVSNQSKLEEGIKCYKAQTYHSAFIKLLPLAEKGMPDAQYAVGVMYYYGKGVNENRKKAIYWFKCAAKQGNKAAIKALEILRANNELNPKPQSFF